MTTTRVKMPLTICEAQLRLMTIDQLRDIYGATNGIVYRSDTKEQLLAVLIRNIDSLKYWKNIRVGQTSPVDPFDGL